MRLIIVSIKKALTSVSYITCIKQKQKIMLIIYNPLTSYLYFKLSYLYVKTYISYYKEICDVIHNRVFTNENEIEDSEQNEDDENGESDKNDIENDYSINNTENIIERVLDKHNLSLNSSEKYDQTKKMLTGNITRFIN